MQYKFISFTQTRENWNLFQTAGSLRYSNTNSSGIHTYPPLHDPTPVSRLFESIYNDFQFHARKFLCYIGLHFYRSAISFFCKQRTGKASKFHRVSAYLSIIFNLVYVLMIQILLTGLWWLFMHLILNICNPFRSCQYFSYFFFSVNSFILWTMNESSQILWWRYVCGEVLLSRCSETIAQPFKRELMQ